MNAMTRVVAIDVDVLDAWTEGELMLVFSLC
jgi:hypothetical protein